MKKLATILITIGAVLALRNGLTDWSLEGSDLQLPGRQAVTLSNDAHFDVVTTTDLGVMRLVLVRPTRRGAVERAGSPMWFVQIPFAKWKPIG